MKPTTSRGTSLALAVLCSAALFFGCATKPAKPKIREDLRSILPHYDVQEYEQCLADIRTALNARNTKEQRANMLMIKGICQEEMGQPDLAKITYKLIKLEFDLTSFADTAQRRLDGKDGDQREHLEVDCGDLGWKRASKRVFQKSVRSVFLPAGETLERYTAKLTLNSMDRMESIKTLEDVEQRAEAKFGLKGGKVKQRHLLDRSANENYWEVESWEPQRGTDVSLARIILTKDRLHVADFCLKKPTLTDAERDKYLACLKKARLVGN